MTDCEYAMQTGVDNALLAMGDIDSALMSLTKASNIEPNDGYVILGSELEVVCTVVIRGFCH